MNKRKPVKAVKAEHADDDGEAWPWPLKASFLCISAFALLVRAAVSLHPYSGAGDPPKYGDFEAQRHWMEITINLPVKEWYRNSTANDLAYWGLDYPPLTAYQSYLHGLVLLMRWTVLSSDALLFFPAVLWFIIVYNWGRKRGRQGNVAWHIAMILLNPCLILIDHGHFQYNCISLGLTVGAVAAILSDKELVASVLFCLALNHKQMSAYFAPAFFSHLLGKCLRRRNPLLEVAKLGLVVLGTFAVVWSPYIHSVDAFLEVVSRLAPFERGIYEDYVANFWCTTSILIKWKRLFTMRSLKLLSLGATVSTCLPSMVQQLRAPSKQGFLYALLNSAFSFYLFSFQVHEKSILLPLLPASLLALEEPFLIRWLTHYALFSMFPLLCRDNLILPYIALYGIFILLCNVPGGRLDTRETHSCTSLRSFLSAFLLLCSFSLHIIYLTVRPPEKYPFLFDAFIMLLCFTQFVLVAIYANRKQWMLSMNSILVDKEKHL
ncbi:hypothetical protein RJ640_011038 [Escallonia rubra]|uniref:Alpha-1,3-glucosyltransferase n=1 Tax=Escallonia rubra TaxID=112253 RepID=A0AA88RJY8_9ASTE|nr:hypothetical protein RJ640_011038 [Escallonia rubra]